MKVTALNIIAPFDERALVELKSDGKHYNVQLRPHTKEEGYSS